MTKVAHQRFNKSEEDQRHERNRIEPNPAGAGKAVVNKVGTKGELVQEAECHRNVGV